MREVRAEFGRYFCVTFRTVLASRKMSNIGLTTLITETKSNPSVPVTYMVLEGYDALLL